MEFILVTITILLSDNSYNLMSLTFNEPHSNQGSLQNNVDDPHPLSSLYCWQTNSPHPHLLPLEPCWNSSIKLKLLPLHNISLTPIHNGQDTPYTIIYPFPPKTLQHHLPRKSKLNSLILLTTFLLVQTNYIPFNPRDFPKILTSPRPKRNN